MENDNTSSFRFNWGHGMAVTIGVFMTMIIAFVYLMFGAKVDLVSENYYESGISYEQKLKKKIDGQSVKHRIDIKFDLSDNKLRVITQSNDWNGKVKFYRPSNKKDDFEIEFNPAGMTIDWKNKPKGYWKALFFVSENGKEYAFEKEFSIDASL